MKLKVGYIFWFLLAFLFVFESGCVCCRQGRRDVADVVVYGGTSGGVAAAVQASRMGKSVILIEPGEHLGGLSSSGLGATDIGNKDAVGGLAKDFYHRIYLHYKNEDVWVHQARSEYIKSKGKSEEDWDKRQTWWMFEPSVAESIFDQLVRQWNIRVVYNERLDLKDGVDKTGSRIVSIKTESGRRFFGRMFIDASYEGDLMAKAGVSYTVGRESNSQYGETLNGVATKRARYHQFNKPVDPYIKPGDPSSGLLPGVHDQGPGEEGSGDSRVQAYNFRMCLTDSLENKVTFAKPQGYDPLRYELLLRYFEAGWGGSIKDSPFANNHYMPNLKTDMNNRGGFATDNIGMNYDYPDGDYAGRAEIVREHICYQQGFMWTLANNPRVPANIRRHANRWGYAKDEFTDNGNWPYQIYVREARRMVSDYVMIEQNCRGSRIAPDPIGLGAYGMDSHNTQRYVDANGYARNEGDVQVWGSSPYPISYRSIVPRENECSNLLVPVCLSASHIAFGSIRMEPVFMILGQSAATAASIAIDEAVSVQKLDYQKLRRHLLSDGQVLEWRRD